MIGNSVSLYIHVPFCSKKCPYCHFFVLPDSKENQAFFLRALYQEWLLKKPLLEGLEIVSIYLGGGTPSLLPPSTIEQILSWIQKGPAKISSLCEITLEANPETTQKDFIVDCLKAGINRVSLGVQSFDDTLLELLGRTHGSKQARQAIFDVFDAGISNISIDLMYELPHQKVEHWERSLQETSTLPITHLSLYNLVFEPGTVFYKKQKQLNKHLPSQEEALQMLERSVEYFPSIDLERYEISAFAKKGYTAIHNTGYWTARPFLGLGPSAFSYFKGRRFRNTSNLKQWASQISSGEFPEDFSEELSPDLKQKELLAVELRLIKGVDLSSFEKANGKLHSELAKAVEHNIETGFLTKTGSQLLLTKKGLLFYDTVAEELM